MAEISPVLSLMFICWILLCKQERICHAWVVHRTPWHWWGLGKTASHTRMSNSRKQKLTADEKTLFYLKIRGSKGLNAISLARFIYIPYNERDIWTSIHKFECWFGDWGFFLSIKCHLRCYSSNKQFLYHHTRYINILSLSLTVFTAVF